MLSNGSRIYWHLSTVLGRVGEMIHKRTGMQAAYAGPEADAAKAFGRSTGLWLALAAFTLDSLAGLAQPAGPVGCQAARPVSWP
ncbi:hypothetical protein IAQ61_002821 [Plenodomus lingam]|uniref:uncharacterized protein n=1 Tax=Leptosphaeria maculans TaxID=5022 RepID=UPI003328E40D|nr:hypothetical protein IAQ61_002821 [Plenodomus lingam]